MKLLIEVENGIVTAVYVSEPNQVEMLLRDIDTIKGGGQDALELHPEYAALIQAKFRIC